ncbi:hypothetical protein GCM10020255_002410 [Rhodococcus baikonurensis]
MFEGDVGQAVDADCDRGPDGGVSEDRKSVVALHVEPEGGIDPGEGPAAVVGSGCEQTHPFEEFVAAVDDGVSGFVVSVGVFDVHGVAVEVDICYVGFFDEVLQGSEAELCVEDRLDEGVFLVEIEGFASGPDRLLDVVFHQPGDCFSPVFAFFVCGEGSDDFRVLRIVELSVTLGAVFAQQLGRFSLQGADEFSVDWDLRGRTPLRLYDLTRGIVPRRWR